MHLVAWWWHKFGGASWWRKLVVADRRWCTNFGVQSKPPSGGTSGGASWWWHKLVVSQGGFGGASLAQVGLAQVWRKLLLNKSRNLRQTCATKPTCAKLAPPPTCAKLAPPLSHHQLAPPLVPPPGGASIKLLCTSKFVHQHLSATTNLRHHLRHHLRLRHQTCATTRWCLLNFALHPRRCASTPPTCHRPLVTPTCATTTPPDGPQRPKAHPINPSA